MIHKPAIAAAIAAISFALPAWADSQITISDAYARTSTMKSTSGAAFMVIENAGDEADQLIDARSDVSKLVELHTHKENDQGVMQMLHVPEGFAIPAGGQHKLARGGDHVMFMGLKHSLAHGDNVTVTLVFEKAGEIEVVIPVDLERKPMHGMNHGQGMKKMKHDSGS